MCSPVIGVLVPALLLFSGCALSQCPDETRSSLTVRIKNGAYEDMCAYEVRARSPSGQWFELSCEANELDCSCDGGARTGTFEVALDGQGSNDFAVELEMESVRIDEDSCVDSPSPVAVFERPPIAGFVRESCEEARQHLDECRSTFSFRSGACVDTRPRNDEAKDREIERCYYGCFLDADCDLIGRSLCLETPSAAEITPLAACLGACFDLSGESLRELANSMTATCEQ